MANANDIRELLDRGLAHYGMGQVQEALATWRQVLAVDPRNSRALEYIRFVEQNWGPPAARATGTPRTAKLRPPADEPTVVAQPPAENFQPPQKPVVEGPQWGELYDFNLGALGGGEAPAPRPVSVPPQASAAPAAQPSPPTKPAVAPSSTLPPHPTVVVPNPLPQTEGALPLQASSFEKPGPTRRYESVPTVVNEKPAPPIAAEFVVPAPILPTNEPVPPCSAPGLFDVCDPTETTVPATPRFEAELQAPVVFTDLGSPLDLVAPPPPSEVDAWLKGAQDLLALDDFTGAIDLLDKILARDPQHAQAALNRAEAEKKLVAMLSSKLGDLNALPTVRMKADEIIWLNLDQRAGFVLSLVDGRTSFEDILTVCGMPLLDGLRILVQLIQEKVIGS
jgi:tetratricopeptide (TPR) repeat protein